MDKMMGKIKCKSVEDLREQVDTMASEYNITIELRANNNKIIPDKTIEAIWCRLLVGDLIVDDIESTDK